MKQESKTVFNWIKRHFIRTNRAFFHVSPFPEKSGSSKPPSAILTVLILAAAVLAAAFVLTGCSRNTAGMEPATESLFAMDTYMTLTAYGEKAEEAVGKAKERIEMLDGKLSAGDEHSEIYALNHTGNAALSEESVYLLKRSMEANEMSAGAFNPLVLPLMECWGFTDQNYAVPGKEEIEECLLLLDMNQLKFDDSSGRVSFSDPGMMLDFGGIAKGYASSSVMELFRECGIQSACISLGGNVHVLGLKPDGSKWKIAVRDPENEEDFLGMLTVSDTAVITSGAYERFFEEDGQIYHHIIDPATGYPAESGIISATIVTDDGTIADALSTAVFVMGLDKAVSMWRESGCSFDMVLMTDDNQLYITESLSGNFTSSKYHINLISESAS